METIATFAFGGLAAENNPIQLVENELYFYDTNGTGIELPRLQIEAATFTVE